MEWKKGTPVAWSPGSSLWSSSASSSFCSSSFFSPGALPASFQHIYFCFNRGQLGSCHSSLNLLTGAGWVSEDAMMTWTVSLTSRNLQPPGRDREGKWFAVWTYIMDVGLSRIKALTHLSWHWSTSFILTALFCSKQPKYQKWYCPWSNQ